MPSPGVALAGTNPALDFTGCSLPSHLTEEEGEPQRGSRQVRCHPAPKREAKVGGQTTDSAAPFCDIPGSTVWLLRGEEQTRQTEEDESTGARRGRAGFGNCMDTPQVQKNDQEESQTPGMGKAVEDSPPGAGSREAARKHGCI